MVSEAESDEYFNCRPTGSKVRVSPSVLSACRYSYNSDSARQTLTAAMVAALAGMSRNVYVATPTELGFPLPQLYGNKARWLMVQFPVSPSCPFLSLLDRGVGIGPEPTGWITRRARYQGQGNRGEATLLPGLELLLAFTQNVWMGYV